MLLKPGLLSSSLCIALCQLQPVIQRVFKPVLHSYIADNEAWLYALQLIPEVALYRYASWDRTT